MEELNVFASIRMLSAKAQNQRAFPSIRTHNHIRIAQSRINKVIHAIDNDIVANTFVIEPI